MKSNEELIEIVRNNINNVVFNNFDDIDFNNYDEIIKKIIYQTSENNKNIEYQQSEDINRECIEFTTLDDIDESKYIVYINEHRIKDRISDISSTQNLEEKRQLTLELLYDIISQSYVVSNQYRNQTSKDIEQNIIGINSLVGENIENKVTYMQRKDSLDKLRFDIEEALNDQNYNNREYIENSLKEYEKKEILQASIREMKDYLSKIDELENQYKIYPSEDKSSVLKRLLKNYKSKIEDIGKYMDSDKEEYEFSQDEDKITNITKSLAGNMEINYKEIEDLKRDYSGSIKKYEILNNDILLAKKYLNNNITYLDIDDPNVPEKIRKLYINIQKDNEKFEFIDPDEIVKQYILETYPEMSISLGKYLQKGNLENAIETLPENVKADIEDILKENGKNYDEFLLEISNKNKNEKKKLEKETAAFDKKYGENLYQEFKEFTSEEKEAFFKYSTIDDSIAQGILKRLEEEAKSVKPYVRKEEISNIINREYEDVKDNDILKDYYKFKEARETNKQNINDKILNIIQKRIGDNKELNNKFQKYFNCKDIAKELNNMDYQDFIYFYDNIYDMRQMIEEIDDESRLPYKDYIDNLGDKLLKVVKYKSDEEFEDILNSLKNDEEKEEIIGIINYQVLKENSKEMNKINLIERYANNIFNENDFILAKQYCNLKYKSMEFNLTEKSALNNIKVLENDEVGVQELINKMNFYESRNLEIDKAKTKNYRDTEINKSDILHKIKKKFERIGLNDYNKSQPDAYIG